MRHRWALSTDRRSVAHWPVAPLHPLHPSPLRGNRLVQRSADFHANRAGFLPGMKANFPNHAGVHERQRAGIDPRRVNDASLAFDRHGELPWLAGRLDLDLQGPAVHHDIDVHRNASNRARCTQRDSAGEADLKVGTTTFSTRVTPLFVVLASFVVLAFRPASPATHIAAAIATISSSSVARARPSFRSRPATDRHTSCRKLRLRMPSTERGRGRTQSSC